MIIRSLKLLFYWSFVVTAGYSVAEENYALSRVVKPTAEQVAKEHNNIHRRALVRKTVQYGSAAAGLTAFYLMCQLSNFVKHREEHERIANLRLNKLEDDMQLKVKKWLFGWKDKQSEANNVMNNNDIFMVKKAKSIAGAGVSLVNNGVAGTKDFFGGLVKNFIELSPTFVASLIVNASYERIKDAWQEATREESVAWYMHKHTKVWELCADIKSNSVHFDIHSSLISSENLQSDANVALKSYVQDLANIMKEQNLEDGFDSSFFVYQCEELKKKYAKKGARIEELQDYAIPLAAKRARVRFGGSDQADLLHETVARKKDIANMCNMLAEDIEKVAAFLFASITKNKTLSDTTVIRGKNKVNYLIEITNNYLAAMETLLNMNDQDLLQESIANKGMFTLSYEFESLLRETVQGVSRYSLLIKNQISFESI